MKDLLYIWIGVAVSVIFALGSTVAVLGGIGWLWTHYPITTGILAFLIATFVIALNAKEVS